VLIATGVVVAVAVVPAESQHLEFTPQIYVSASYTDNAFLSSEDSTDLQSDVYYSLGLNLPLARELEHGSLGLSYGLNIDRFQDFDELDNVNQRLGFSFSTATSSTSTFNLGLGYSFREDPFGLSDREQIEVENFDGPLFIVDRRLEGQQATINTGFSKQFSPRGSVQFFAGYSAYRSDEIEGDEARDDVEDRDQAGAGVGLSRTLSPYTSLGLSYGISGFDLHATGESLSHSLSMGWTRNVGDRLSTSFQIGAYYRDRVVEMVNEDGTSVTKDDVGVQGAFGLSRTLERYALSFSVSHRPSAGYVLVGTSTDTQVSFSLSPQYTERWAWGVSLRYGHRDPDLVDQNPIHSFQGGGSVHRSLGRKLGVSIGGDFHTQNEAEAAQYDIVTFRARLSLVFIPIVRSP
jgi:hypothetical protein